MTNTLREIIISSEETVKYFRIQNFYFGNQSLKDIITSTSELVTKFSNYISEGYMNEIINSLNTLLTAQENNDYILIADMLEIQHIPLLKQLMLESLSSNEIVPDFFVKNINFLNDKSLAEKIVKNYKRLDSIGNYSVEITNLGVYTLKYQNDNNSFYFHSNTNPIDEGNMLAQYHSKSDIYSYNIFGFGLGYHVNAFLNLDQRYTVTVFENNLDILTIAFAYCDLSLILANPRFHLKFGDISIFTADLSSNNSIAVIHYPSLKLFNDGPVKEAINNYFINTNSMHAQGKFLDWNFYYNQQNKDTYVEEVACCFNNKNVVYAAGGPSLENTLDYLRTIQNNLDDYTIICASTSYKGLLNEGIIPDFVIIIDPQDIMINHFINTPLAKTKMLYLATAYHGAVSCFKGDKYIIYQQGYKPSEEFAEKNELMLFETHGSVSTLAIDLALKFNCKSLTTLGLDLGHTNQMRHCFNENDKSSIDKDLIYVPAIVGKNVETTHILNIYRKWIEQRLNGIKNINLVNVSDGAIINGMQNINTNDFKKS